MSYFRKDWILYQEVVSDGGKRPEELLDIKVKNPDPDDNKHVPFIIEQDNGYLVKVGKNEYHPTTKEHKTMFVELVVDCVSIRKLFKIGETPELFFETKKGESVEAFAFCNLHGLFTYKLK